MRIKFMICIQRELPDKWRKCRNRVKKSRSVFYDKFHDRICYDSRLQWIIQSFRKTKSVLETSGKQFIQSLCSRNSSIKSQLK